MSGWLSSEIRRLSGESGWLTGSEWLSSESEWEWMAELKLMAEQLD